LPVHSPPPLPPVPPSSCPSSWSRPPSDLHKAAFSPQNNLFPILLQCIYNSNSLYLLIRLYFSMPKYANLLRTINTICLPIKFLYCIEYEHFFFLPYIFPVYLQIKFKNTNKKKNFFYCIRLYYIDTKAIN
jgi:hypothetical protein